MKRIVFFILIGSHRAILRRIANPKKSISPRHDLTKKIKISSKFRIVNGKKRLWESLKKEILPYCCLFVRNSPRWITILLTFVSQQINIINKMPDHGFYKNINM